MKRGTLDVAIAVLLLCACMSSQTPPASAEGIPEYVQRLMETEVRFEEMVPDGTSIEAKEISRKGTSGKDLVVQYHIFVKGAPPDALFQWLQWPVTREQPFTALDGISLDHDGMLICAGRTPQQCGDPRKPDDPIDFISQPRKGEPVRFAFVSPQVKIGLVIVPDPIQSRHNGCTLSAVRLTPMFELAFVSGAGYPPNADVHYRFSTEMVSDRVIRSDGSGRIRVGLIPYPGNKRQGTATVKITEDNCSPELAYEWGTI